MATKEHLESIKKAAEEQEQLREVKKTVMEQSKNSGLFDEISEKAKAVELENQAKLDTKEKTKGILSDIEQASAEML